MNSLKKEYGLMDKTNIKLYEIVFILMLILIPNILLAENLDINHLTISRCENDFINNFNEKNIFSVDCKKYHSDGNDTIRNFIFYNVASQIKNNIFYTVDINNVKFDEEIIITSFFDKKNIIFRNCIFDKKIIIGDCSIKSLIISGSLFNDQLKIFNLNIDGMLDLHQNIFKNKKYENIIESILLNINGKLNIADNSFSKKIAFDSLSTTNDVSLVNNSYNTDDIFSIKFYSSVIGKNLYICSKENVKKINELSIIDLDGVKVINNLYIENCKISKHVKSIILKNSHIGNNVYFKKINIKGEIDLSSSKIGNDIYFDDAYIDNSDRKSITFDNSTTEGSIFFNKNINRHFFNRGIISLVDFKLSGSLFFNGGIIENNKGATFQSERSSFKGGIFIRDGFVSNGKFVITDSEINGPVNFNGAKFKHNDADNYSINMSNNYINGQFSLNTSTINKIEYQFESIGEFTINNSTINGLFFSNGGKFYNDNGPSLTSQCVKFNRGIFLRRGFSSYGMIDLSRSEIFNIAEFDGGNFIHNDLDIRSINLNNTKISNSVTFSNFYDKDKTIKFVSNGMIDLSNATVDNMMYSHGGEFSLNNNSPIFCKKCKIKNGIIFDSGFISNGTIILSESDIGNTLNLEGAILKKSENNEISVDLSNSVVNGDINLSSNEKNEFHSFGQFNLSGTVVNGLLYSNGGFFDNENSTSINGQRSTVKKGIFLRYNFQSNGIVDFSYSNIYGLINLTGGKFNIGDLDSNRNSYVINFEKSNIYNDILIDLYYNNDKQIPSVLNGGLNISNSIITGSVKINKSEINGKINSIYAYNSKIKNVDIYNDVNINGRFNFKNSIIDGDFSVGDGNIISDNEAFNFYGAKISGDLNIGSHTCSDKCTLNINGTLQLSNINIDNDLTVINIIIKNDSTYDVCAQSSKINRDVYINNINIEKSLNFNRSNILGSFKLSDMKKTDKYKLILSNSNIKIMDDDQNSWPSHGNLYIDNLKYENITIDKINRIDWLSRQFSTEGNDSIKNKFNTQPYEELAKYYKSAGRETQSKDVQIAKNNDIIKSNTTNLLESYLSRFLGLIIDYGYNPFKILWCISANILIGNFIFYIGIKSDVIYTKNHKRFLYPLVSSLVMSIDRFIPIVNLLYNDVINFNVNYIGTFIIMNKKFRVNSNFILSYARLHIFLGWIFTTIFIAGLAGAIKS